MRYFLAVRGTALMGLAWAAAWTPLGALLSVIWDPAAARDRIFVPVGALPGLLCQPWNRGRPLAGLFVGALPVGIGQPPTDLPIELLAAETSGPMAMLGAASAVASVLLARMVKDLRGGGAHAA